MSVLSDILNKNTPKPQIPVANRKQQTPTTPRQQPATPASDPSDSSDSSKNTQAQKSKFDNIELPKPTVDLLPKDNPQPLDFGKAKLAKHEDIPAPPPIKSWLDPIDPITRQQQAEKQQTPTSDPSDKSDNAQKPLSFREMAERIYAADKPDPEEQERERKRERSRAVLSALGDGISALANLHFTNKYAPNIPQTPLLSEKGKERWDKWQQARKQREEQYNAAMLRADTADKEFNFKERELARKEAADAAQAARDAKKLENEWNLKCADLKIKLQNAKTAEEKATADKAYKEAEHARKTAADEARAAAQRETTAIRKAQLAEQGRHNRTMEGIASYKAAKGNKSDKPKYFLSGKQFSIGRATNLSPQEMHAIYQHGVVAGWINTADQKNVENAFRKGQDAGINAIAHVIGKLPSWTPQAKEFLINNYGFTNVNNRKSTGFKRTKKSSKNLGLK